MLVRFRPCLLLQLSVKLDQPPVAILGLPKKKEKKKKRSESVLSEFI